MARYRATVDRVKKYVAIIKNQPLTVAQFAARAHCDRSTATGYIKILHDAGLIHLEDWVTAPAKKPVARYAYGKGEDAPQPPKKPKHPPKAERDEPLARIGHTLTMISPITSVWLAWEKIAINEGRQHAVLPRYDFLLWSLQKHAMQSAPVPHEEQHEPAAAMPRRPVRELSCVHSGIGGT